MTNQNYGAPPPPPKKGGLPTWAWIVLGCLLVLILGAGATCVGAYWFAKKATDKLNAKVTEWENDPSSFAMDAAEFGLKNNPEVELLEMDRAAKTFTVRNKKTGEVTTVSLADIQEGKFSVETGGQEMNVDVDSGQDGSINVSGPDGTKLQIGGGAGTDIPDWVPGYPGATPQGMGSMQTGTERSGAFTFTTGGSVAEILDHYEQELKDAGFTIELRSTSGTDGGLIAARSAGRNVNVGVTRTGTESQVSVNFNEKIGG